MTNFDLDDMDPDVGHISELDSDTVVIAQGESGEWVETTVGELLELEESGDDLG